MPLEQTVPLHLPREKPTTLRRILRDHVDVRQPPRKSFFEWLARFTTSEVEKERLEEFLVDPVSAGGVSKGVFCRELTLDSGMDRTRFTPMLQRHGGRYWKPWRISDLQRYHLVTYWKSCRHCDAGSSP